jgi:hypothetical protein
MPKNTINMLFKLEQICVSFDVKMGISTEKTFFHRYTHKSMLHNMMALEKLWVSGVFLKIPTHNDMILLFLSSQQMHVIIHHILKSYINTLWHNPNKIPTILSTSWIVMHVIMNKFLDSHHSVHGWAS